MKTVIKKIDDFVGRHYYRVIASALLCLGATIGLAACGDDDDSGGARTNTPFVFDENGYASHTTPAGTFVECYDIRSMNFRDIECVARPFTGEP